MTASVSRVVVALLLVVSGVGATGAALAQSQAQADEKPYTLDELNGMEVERVQGGVPSERYLPQDGTARIWHAYANPLKNPSDRADWEVVKYLRPGSTVKTNELHLKFFRSRNAPAENYTFVMAFYDEKTRTVTEGNTTREERYATNVSVSSQEFRLTQPREQVDVRLPGHYNQSKQAVAWLEDSDGDRVEGAVWRWGHKSSDGAAPVAIDTAGDLALFVMQNVLGPAVIVSLIVGFAAMKMRKNGKYGPQWGYFPYAVLALFGSFVIVYSNWDGITSLWRTAPAVSVLMLASISFVQQIEGGGESFETWDFRQTILTKAVSPAGEEVKDALKFGRKTKKVMRTGDGPVIKKSGWLAFLSRQFGTAAYVENFDDLDTRVEGLSDSDSDMEVQVSVHSEKIIDYQPEGWTRRPLLRTVHTEVEADDESTDLVAADKNHGKTRPNWESCLRAGAAFAVPYALSIAFVGPGLAATTGLVTALVSLYKPTDGYLRCEPAPVHARPAEATAVHAADGYEQAETFEKQRMKMVEQRSEPWSKALNIMDAEAVAMGDSLDDLWSSDPPEPDEEDDRRKNGHKEATAND